MCKKQICWLAAILMAGLALCACLPPAGSEAQSELMVFAAMSLKKPMSEIVHIYEGSNPGLKVNLNCSGSSNLVAQVSAGAPADVFASASNWDMDALLDKGFIDPATRRIFSNNSLVLIAPAGTAGKLNGFRGLTSADVKRIAVGNSKLTPAGIYTAQVLNYYGIREQVKDRLIYCDTVAQICDYVIRGEVDAGIVYRSDYQQRQGELALVENAPVVSHQLIEYPVALLKHARSPVHAHRFIDLLCSKQGMEVMVAHGFHQLLEASR